MTSATAKALDSRYNCMQWMGEEYLLEEVLSGAGEALSGTGEVFPKDVLYWIGYIYRYWHYYSGEDSAKIFRQAPTQTGRPVAASAKAITNPVSVSSSPRYLPRQI